VRSAADRTARAARLALALAAVAALPACGGEAPGPAREHLLRRATRHVSAILRGAVDRARAALDEAGPALGAPGVDRARRFAALKAVRERTGVDGILWDGPDGETLWAGTPVEPRDPPVPKPWEGTFTSGDVTWHAGPFRRAVVVERGGVAGGVAAASVVLSDPAVGPLEGTVETAWAENEGVRSVRVLDPAASLPPPGPAVQRTGIRGDGDARDVMLLEVVGPGDEAMADRGRETDRRHAGYLWIAALGAAAAAAVALGRRVLPTHGRRAAAIGALALALRGALGALDLPTRFRALAPAFRSIDFGLPGWLGWIASPGDFLLTCAAALVAAWGAATLVAEAPPRRRGAAALATAAVGVALATVSTVGWRALVEAAALHTRIDYFAPGSLLPDLPRALMLSGLAGATAAAFLLARSGIALSLSAAPKEPSPRVRLAAGAGVGVLVALLSLAGAGDAAHAWTAFAVPVVAGALAALGSREDPGGAPSRVLVTSVLATVLLFPVLWVGVRDAARADVAGELSGLVGREEEVVGQLRLDLEPLVDDPYVTEALVKAADGKRPPEGVALSAWRRIGLFGPGGEKGAVTVLRTLGGHLDRFSLDAPPFERLPPASPPSRGAPDLTVERGVETPGGVRSAVGRVRMRRPGGAVVGTLVVTVPDALALELEGLSRRVALGGAEEERPRRAPLLSMSLVKDGRVVATNDPGTARASPPVPFDPATLDGPTWLGGRPGGADWLAVPAGERGTLLARCDLGGFPSLLFALARLVIVAVGLGGALALVVLASGRDTYRPRLRGKILGSYFAISVLPVVALGWANWKDALARGQSDFESRQQTLVRSARRDLETLKGDLFSELSGITSWAKEKGYDLSIYRGGTLHASSIGGLVEAEILPARLPAAAYVATEVERRDYFARDEGDEGHRVRVGYAPLVDEGGATVGTVAVPMRYDSARAEREAAQTGSLLLAAYLLTLVLIVVIGIYTARGLTRPLDALAAGTERVAAGELDVTLPGEGRDELGSLVSSFNRMTSDLKAARARAAEAEREAAWRGMARQVAHEIKNPLTPMKLMLQQLQATARDDPAYAARTVGPTARVVLEQIDALARIAGDFSAFARFPPRAIADADVNQLLRSVAALYGAGDGAPGTATVETRLAEGLPPVRWDLDELRRVFVNLVANAVEARDPAKERVRVVVSSRAARHGAKEAPGVLVTVEDDGVGIPPEGLARLYQPDFSTKSGGTGLGLAIVKRIVSDLGGDVSIVSTPGHGTTASVWLPATPAEGAPAA
jgi:signal transduction histidine kinase